MLHAPAINSIFARQYPVRCASLLVLLLRTFPAACLAVSASAHAVQVLLGGLSQWTVGLIATFVAVACVIAADVGAFFVGKTVGRTPLSEISPKKTVEGAAGGLLCR